jgi:mRNA interferase MazF
MNGLTKTSAVDALQLRGLDVARSIRKLGTLEQDEMEAITEAIVLVVEHEL